MEKLFRIADAVKWQSCKNNIILKHGTETAENLKLFCLIKSRIFLVELKKISLFPPHSEDENSSLLEDICILKLVESCGLCILAMGLFINDVDYKLRFLTLNWFKFSWK